MNKLFVVAIALLAASASAHEFASAHTKELTAKNYEDEVSSGKVYLVAYFAPWCGHCKRLAPTWQQLGAALKDNSDVVIAYIDCTQAKEVCSSAGIKGYPTIKAVHKAEEYKKYQGPREVDNLKTFITDAATALLKESS